MLAKREDVLSVKKSFPRTPSIHVCVSCAIVVVSATPELFSCVFVWRNEKFITKFFTTFERSLSSLFMFFTEPYRVFRF